MIGNLAECLPEVGRIYKEVRTMPKKGPKKGTKK